MIDIFLNSIGTLFYNYVFVLVSGLFEESVISSWCGWLLIPCVNGQTAVPMVCTNTSRIVTKLK